jgi:uncharacterized membrane protein
MRKVVRAASHIFTLSSMQPSALLAQILLVSWIVLAAVLRFHNLMLKPLWTDEFSTLVFGLGNSFTTIPLDQVISEAALLQPVQLTTDTSIFDAAHKLLSESNHPPLYFMLTHWWVHWFPAVDGYVSIWAARSLSVLFGVLAVPAMYGVGWIVFRRRAIAHLSAALMAVSPFGIYLAQDARHYTLTVLWIILSLGCWFVFIQHYGDRKPSSPQFLLGWISVNALGMASHYFFVMTLVAEAIALIVMVALDHHRSQTLYRRGIRQAFIVSLGTAASIIVWAPFLFAIRQGDALTNWLVTDGWANGAWINPLLHTLGSIVSMVILLPVQNVDDAVVLASALGIAGCAILLGWCCVRGITAKLRSPIFHNATTALLAFTAGAIAIILLGTYILGLELAQVFRYHFFYFPGVLWIIAIGLTHETPPTETSPTETLPTETPPSTISARSPASHSHRPRVRGGIAVGLIMLGIVGSFTVTHDLGYRKLHRPDRIVREIHQQSDHPVLVAIAHQTHGQTGRLMALAWEMRSPQYRDAMPRTAFLLDHQRCTATNPDQCDRPTDNLRAIVQRYAQPLDLWLMNYEGQANLRKEGCQHQKTKRTDGYKAQHYRCHV